MAATWFQFVPIDEAHRELIPVIVIVDPPVGGQSIGARDPNAVSECYLHTKNEVSTLKNMRIAWTGVSCQQCYRRMRVLRFP